MELGTSQGETSARLETVEKKLEKLDTLATDFAKQKVDLEKLVQDFTQYELLYSRVSCICIRRGKKVVGVA